MTMKLKILTLLTGVLSLISFFPTANAQNIQRKDLRQIENVNEVNTEFNDIEFSSNANRVSNKKGGGNIIKTDNQDNSLSIICDDITSDGIGSSYATHTFALSHEDVDITDFQWSFYLKQKTGEFYKVSERNSEFFIIDKIQSSDELYVNINGDFEGKIECRYTLDGISNEATPFYLSLEQKPVIFSIDNIKRNQKEDSFTLEFDINYGGADYFKVQVEEESSSILQTQYFYEPFTAHVVTNNISSYYYSWVTIEVENQYGKTTETLEFEPYYWSDFTDNEIEVDNIKFEYEIVQNSDKTLDCQGTLSLEALVPYQTQIAVINRTRPHLKDGDRQSFLLKSVFENTKPGQPIKMSTNNNVRWGTYFRIEAYSKDGETLFSPVFCINDYIKPEDLVKFMQSSDVEDTLTTDIAIRFKDNILTLNCENLTLFSIFDIYGNILYQGHVSGFKEIPLTSNLIIVQYLNNGEIFTQKLLSL